MTDHSHILSNVDDVRTEIRLAAERAGRNPADITLIAVTKTYDIDNVAAAARAGISNAGENRIQEALPKIDALRKDSGLHPLRWHLIGHLQSNKARQAVQNFDLIHSLDSIRLAGELNRHAGEENKLMSILMQLNVSGEESKGGFSPEKTEDSINQILESYPNLNIQGFMTMAPFTGPEEARPVFKALRELKEDISCKINHPRFYPLELSMGMSNDYKVAIAEGSTMVRIGTAIFGNRANRR